MFRGTDGRKEKERRREGREEGFTRTGKKSKLPSLSLHDMRRAVSGEPEKEGPGRRERETRQGRGQETVGRVQKDGGRR